MSGVAEKSGGSFRGIKLLLCENPLPPIDEAVAAARAHVPKSNFCTEPYSAPLRRLISEQPGAPERLVHINANSELVLRLLFDRFGQQVHLLTPATRYSPRLLAAIVRPVCGPTRTSPSTCPIWRFPMARRWR